MGVSEKRETLLSSEASRRRPREQRSEHTDVNQRCNRRHPIGLCAKTLGFGFRCAFIVVWVHVGNEAIENEI